jgi:hypothetical protein
MPNVPFRVKTEGCKYFDVFVKLLLIYLNVGQNFAVLTHSESVNFSIKNKRQNKSSETSVMRFIFNLSRMKSLYMFRALLAHPQEALNKQHLVYCVRVMSVGCTKIGTPILVQPTDITRTQCTKCLFYVFLIVEL